MILYTKIDGFISLRAFRGFRVDFQIEFGGLLMIEREGMDVDTFRPGSSDEGGGGSWFGNGHSKAKNRDIVR